MKRLLSLIMVCVLTMSMATGVAAASSSSVERSAVHHYGEPIGTLADSEDELPVFQARTRAAKKAGLPFTLYANGAYGLLTTYHSDGKNFTGRDIDDYHNKCLLISGTLTNTAGQNIKVGACSYDVRTDTFIAADYKLFPSGKSDKLRILKRIGGTTYLGDYTTYYGFINNVSGQGTVSGSLNYSSANK